MADTKNDVPEVEARDADEVGDVIRPVRAGTEAPEDDIGAESFGDASRPQTGGDGSCARGEDEGAADMPPSARPASARPDSARPPSARPESAKPDSSRPPSARPESAKPDSARPPSARPGSAKPESTQQDAARPPSATADVSKPASATSSFARPPSVRTGGAEGAEAEPGEGVKPAVEGQGEGEAEAQPERPGTSQHPDVITDINQSPEAHAEVDEIAQQQAREVIRSRQNSASSERRGAAAPAEEDKRRASASNASVRSAPPSRQGPDESIANMAMQPPSPSKIKSGPWLTGTYRLPKSGKIISGEELCDALERMTNAYIDKYTREKSAGPPPKEIPPGAATVFNTKKLSQDEYDAMISRLYKPKDRNVSDGDRISLITLKFGEDGQEQWTPVKQVSVEEQQEYMCQLYQRCLDNRKKTQDELAAKYLKPLGAPRKR